MKAKYRLVAPEIVRKFERACFADYTSLGFSSLERVDPQKQKVTILRRKSLDKIFVEDNFKLLERDVSDFGSSMGSRNEGIGNKSEAKPAKTADSEGKTAAVDSKVRVDYLLSRDTISSAIQLDEANRKKFGGFKNGKLANGAYK